jgi:cyclophilin family peptidyl-prolyl cis-trans isomerase
LYSRLQTTAGTIVFRLYEKECPRTVANFVDLAAGKKEFTDPKTGRRVKRPLYNGLVFHRVIPGFMIQGGDPQGNGMGGTDPIGEEYYPTLKFDKVGRVAMARSQQAGSSSSQFFITDGLRPDLNGRYTVFGQVVSGQAVVTKIANLPRNPENDRPHQPARIVGVTFTRIGPAPK